MCLTIPDVAAARLCRIDSVHRIDTDFSHIVEDVAARWSLTLEPPFPPTPGSPGNFVAPATRADGSEAVLKVSGYVSETRNEIEALRLWDGVGAARLLEAEPDLGALLLERIRPGTILADITDDDETVRAAAGVLRKLWRSLPAECGFRSLDSWCAAYDRNRTALSSGEGGFPTPLFQRADSLRSELLASTTASVALHGDLHHFNVLRSDRDGWVCIDPKGLAGDRCFDVCQFLRNPEPVPAAQNRRRLDIFCSELGLDRARVTHWAVVHAVLDACWDFEEGHPWQSAVEYANQTLTF